MRSLHQSANDAFLSFTSSVDFDKKLWRYDIAGSIAHAHTLANAGVLTDEELVVAVNTLKGIAKKLSEDGFKLDPGLEDIHMNIEQLMIDMAGDVGRKLHTARSRNDQIALDMRLYVREAIADIIGEVIELQNQLVNKAQENSMVIMPGYTHLQHAQPVLLSHHLLAYFWKLQKDIGRLADCYRRTNVSPLGAGALAGTSFEIDRAIASKMLGMEGVTENSSA